MSSQNEWSQLKKVIVGIADEAKIPEIDLSMRTFTTDKDIQVIYYGNTKNLILHLI